MRSKTRFIEKCLCNDCYIQKGVVVNEKMKTKTTLHAQPNFGSNID